MSTKPQKKTMTKAQAALRQRIANYEKAIERLPDSGKISKRGYRKPGREKMRAK